MIQADFVVVGAGLTGATIARCLADAGHHVIVIDKRATVAGNIHDQVHSSGIRYHSYGPHYFRTSSQRIWDFVRRFSQFTSYEARLLTFANSRLYRWPLHREDLVALTGNVWSSDFTGLPSNFEEACLSFMPDVIYKHFVKEYTEKQWGAPANSLSPNLARRLDIRSNSDDRLSTATFQGLPVNGYTRFVEAMLLGIDVLLNTSFDTVRQLLAPKCRLVYTGPIDEFFNYRLGHLEYRGQRRTHTFYSHEERRQAAVQVNYPELQSGPHIRTIEWKHMMSPCDRRRIGGTLITEEIPFTPAHPDDFEYPFPDERNRRLYSEYCSLGRDNSRVLFCGRLGEYKYLDMDQAIGRAMMHYEHLVA